MTKLPEKTLKVFKFLDEIKTIKHNESEAEMIRLNFGDSWALCYEYVNLYKEER